MSRQKGTISFGPNFAYALCVKRIKDSELEGSICRAGASQAAAPSPSAPRTCGLRRAVREGGLLREGVRQLLRHGRVDAGHLVLGLGKHGVVDEVDGDAAVVQGQGRGGRARRRARRPCGELRAVVRGTRSPSSRRPTARAVTPLPERTVGEIRLRGPSLMRGYWNDAELTREGVRGRLAEDRGHRLPRRGQRHICGRSKEVIIVNGRNYYPQDLEWEASRVEGVRKGNVIAFGTMKPTHDRERVIIVLETSIPDGEQRRPSRARSAARCSRRSASRSTTSCRSTPACCPRPRAASSSARRPASSTSNGELLSRTSIRRADKVEVVKEVVKSQIGYFRHALLGSRKD
jgi:fatty-acyl-CoA synthase